MISITRVELTDVQMDRNGHGNKEAWLVHFEFSVIYGGVNGIILHAIITHYLVIHDETNGRAVVQCIKSNRNFGFGHYESLRTALGPGLRGWYMSLTCGSGHINSTVQALILGQSINLHSALSLGYYCLNRYITRGPWATTSPECTAIKAIFSLNTVNVACKKN